MSTESETILLSLALAAARYQNATGEPPDMLIIHTSRADELKAEFNKQKLYAAEVAAMPVGALCLFSGIPVHASPFLAPDQIVAQRDEAKHLMRERHNRQIDWFDSFIDSWRR